MPKNKKISPYKKRKTKFEVNNNKVKKNPNENSDSDSSEKKIIHLKKFQLKIQKNKLKEIYQMH